MVRQGSQGHRTHNDVHLLVPVTLNKDVDRVFESLMIQQQRRHISEHNACTKFIT